MAGHVLGLVDEVALAIDAVARQIRPQVGSGSGVDGLGRARVGHLEHRARLRVVDAEAQEVERVGRGQDDEIGLRVAGREARRGA